MLQMALALLSSVVAIAVAIALYRKVVAAPASNPRAAEIAAATTYPNPRAVTREAVLEILERAY